MRKNLEAGTHSAALGIIAAVDNSRNARLNDCAGAHATRFHGYVQRRARKAIVPKDPSAFSQQQYFRMRGRIAILNRAVTRLGHDFAVVYQNGADGNLAGCGRGTSFVQSPMHESNVGVHTWRENSTA